MFTNYQDFLDIYVARDWWRTTLSSDISSSGEEVHLTSIESLPSKGWLNVDGEYLFYNYLNSGEEVVSGLERSTPAAHIAGDDVFLPFSGEVINYLIEAVGDKDGLRNDLYVTSTNISEDYKDIFDFMDNYKAINNWSQLTDRYLSSSGEEVTIDANVSDLPDRGRIFIYGEEVFYNSKSDENNTLSGVHRTSGIEHPKGSPVEQMISATDWNWLQKASANVTMESYALGKGSGYYSYSLPSASGNDIDVNITVKFLGDCNQYPPNGREPVFGARVGSNNIGLHFVSDTVDNSMLRLTINNSIIYTSANFLNIGVHNIRLKLEGYNYTIWRNGSQLTTGNSPNDASTYDTHTLCEHREASTDYRANQNMQMVKIQGTWNNGRPYTAGVRSTADDAVDTIENLSYLGGNITQINSSYQANYLLY